MKDKQLESCVFYFFNETEVKNNTTKRIHKIVQTDFLIENELTNTKHLLKTKDRKKHFYLCENTSALKLAHISE